MMRRVPIAATENLNEAVIIQPSFNIQNNI
jgi:hypothetical protein